MNSRLLPFDTAPAALRRRARPPEAPDRVDVRDLWGLLWRRRRTVLGAMAVGLVLALLAGFLMTPQYKGVAKLMLVSHVPQTSASQQVVQDIQVNDQTVNSVVTVLQSNVLINQALNAIGLDKLDAMDPANQSPSLVALAQAYVKSLLPKKPEPPSLLTPAQAKMQRLVWQVVKNLKVSRETQSNVVDITVWNTNPVLAEQIANALADAYIRSQVQSRRLVAGDATKVLETRLAQMKSDVAKAEDAVDKYRAAHLITDGGTLDAATQQLGQLNNQLVVARSDRIAAQAAYNQLQDVIKAKGMTAVADLVSSKALDQLNAQLMSLQRQDAIWAQNYGPKHPERVRLAAEIKGVKADVAIEVQKLVAQKKSDLATAQLREKNMQQSIAAMETRVVGLSQSTIGLRQLERVANSARAAYDGLLSRVNEVRTEAVMQQPDSQIIERAIIPTLPASPRTSLMGVIGGMLGLVLGFAVVFFQEVTAPSYAQADDLEQETGLPVLAVIPRGDWKDTLGAWDELTERPYGLFAERIRLLRTALLARDSGAPRSLLIASSVPDEGKTTTALTLARMAALAGRRVVLVDGDLRRPLLAQTFGWELERDFTDFIANRCSLRQAIRHDPALGFDVLAAARPQPDAADELSTEWLEPMMKALNAAYDLVIVDAPPSLAVADALVLGRVVDECIYLVRWRETARKAVDKGLTQFAEAGVTVSGTVLTQIDPRAGADVYARNYDYSS